MKNILNYYYGMIVSKIDNNGYFSYDNHLFCLYKITRSIDEINSLVLLNNYMLNNNIKVNKIVFNNYHKPVTFFDKEYYVLILIEYEYHGGYFKFIPSPMDNQFNNLKRNDWATLWELKVDYLEHHLLLNSNYPLLQDSINYYIGLTENAIEYFHMLSIGEIPLFISHRRIRKNLMYNPLEFIFDYKVRDISEYLKIVFFQKEKSIYDIKKIINNLDLNYIDYLLLYNRMLYPSFYFDLYDEIIQNNEKEEKILDITNLSNEYEELLYEIYLLINRKKNILGIDWINRKFNE